jgi:Mor family transcriptional regulator
MALLKTFQEVIDLIGPDAAQALVARYGGTDIAMPTGKVDGGKFKRCLIELVGEEATIKLMRHYGGDRLYVPRCQDFSRLERNREIIAKYDRGGVTTNDLALEYALTSRHITTILKTVPPSSLGVK